jgi:hypothetical protein
VNVNSITAICAVIIALASLVVTLMEARAGREHNRHSVRPVLQVVRFRLHGDTRAGLKIRNVGLGPAVIVGTVVQLDGNAIGAWDRATFTRLIGTNRPVPFFGSLYDGAVIPQGDEQSLIFIDPYREKRHSWFWRLVAYRLNVEVQYESLYGGENFIASKPPRQPTRDDLLA